MKIHGSARESNEIGYEWMLGWRNWVFRKLYNKLRNELQTYWMNCAPKSLSGEYWIEIEGNWDGWAGWGSQAQGKSCWIPRTAGTA